MNKKILSFILMFTLLFCNFVLPTIVSAAPITEPKVVFSLSDDIAKADGTQVELTLTAYNINFNTMQFTLGYDPTKVQLANKTNNTASTLFRVVHTVLAEEYDLNAEETAMKGWYTAGSATVNNIDGSVDFTFMADPESREVVDGSNAAGWVETDENGLPILKLHFRKLGDIDASTFKILTGTDTGGNPANSTGTYIVTEGADLTDPSYVAFDLGEVTPPADEEAPVITLIGDATITVTKGATFTDPGVTITDNVDTDLQPVITYTKDGAAVDSIDTNVVGTYVIHYNATDTAGNKADEVTRTVIVKEVVIPTPGAKITVGSATAKQGETVTVPVNVADLGEAYGYQVAISYDTAVFTNAVIKNIAGNASENNTSDGEIRVAAGSELPLGAITKLFDIELTISETAAIADTNLAVTEAKLAMEAGEATADVLANATDGVVTVVSAADKTNLIALIGEVEELLATTTAGDKPGQYGTTERTALETALASAETVRDNVSATPTDVTNAETALTNAKTAYEASKKAVYGDVNGDGNIDSADVTLVLKYIVKSATLDADQKVRANVNGDADVDISDAVLILRFVNEKISKFPVEQ